MLKSFRGKQIEIILHIESGTFFFQNIPETCFSISDENDLIENFKVAKKTVVTDYNNKLLLSEGIVFLTDDCNMACPYCFVGEKNRHGAMTEDTAYKTLSFFRSNTDPQERFSLVFFGGEPLIEFPLMKKITAEAKRLFGRQVGFSITTNALLLNDEITDFFLEENITPLFSLDGPPFINDRFRSSGFKIEENLLRAKKLGLPIGVRVTYTPDYFKLSEICDYFRNLGCFSVIISPVSHPKMLFSAEKLSELHSELDNLYKIQIREFLETGKIGMRVNSFEFGIQDIFFTKPRKPCSAGRHSVAVLPNGDLIPCGRFAENKEFILGNVSQKTCWNSRMCNWQGPGEQLKCNECWLKGICGGGCPGFLDNNLIENQCEFEKLNYEALLTSISEIDNLQSISSLISHVKKNTETLEKDYGIWETENNTDEHNR
ncbi:MAG: SPASM domain-containing protein [Candidatus Riflebacteria bacterium]|nr:SPASM domain-containing protein [Candidatus Riflebacteria bacterium]